MITLDEVLEAMINEICLNSKADCWEVPVDLYGVIVHYLHEYRTLQYSYIKAMADLEDNPALSWDELKEMVGKPVWVVVDGKERWCIIREVTKEHLILESGLPLHRSWMNHPDGWQAYRKERK